MTKKEKNSLKSKSHYSFGRRLFCGIMLLFNIIIAIGLLLAGLAPNVTPVLWILPSYAGLAFVPLFCVNGLFFFFWLFARKAYALIPFVMCLLVLPSIKNTYGHALKKNKEKIVSEQQIKILSYNTMALAKYIKPTSRQVNPVLDYIVETDADVVCLQEFAVSTQPQHLTWQDVRQKLYKYPYSHISYKINNSMRKIGIATFSKYPIIRKRTIEYESNYNVSQYSDIVVGKDTIRVFNNHLESNRLTGKDIHVTSDMKNNFDTKVLTDYAGYMGNKLAVANRIRAKQSDMVAAEINKSPYRVVVCGDFNDVPVSYTYKTIKGYLVDAFTECSSGLGLTFKDSWLRVRIDYILHDATLSASDFYTDKKNDSDHYPIHCQLKLK